MEIFVAACAVAMVAFLSAFALYVAVAAPYLRKHGKSAPTLPLNLHLPGLIDSYGQLAAANGDSLAAYRTMRGSILVGYGALAIGLAAFARRCPAEGAKFEEIRRDENRRLFDRHIEGN